VEWPDVAQMIRHRYAMISYLDEQVGRILDALERTGQDDNTLFIYTADHGDFSGSHGLFHLGVPAFDYVYRVPLVIRWPAGIRNPGRQPDPFVSLLDVGPTILEATGAPPLARAHGRSLLPFLRGEAPAGWREEFYGEFLGHESLYTQRQIRTRSHKYVWNSFDYDELYDLTLDPDETVNRRDDPAYADVQRDLIMRLWRWAIETEDVMRSAYPMNGNLPFGPGIVPGVEGGAWNARLRAG
jgi:arylsulfatase A-like enzyme